MIKNFFDYLDRGLSGEIDPFIFSIDLETYLVDNYDEMYKENPRLTLLANDEIPDIAETMEPNDDPAEFYRELNNIKNQLIELK